MKKLFLFLLTICLILPLCSWSSNSFSNDPDAIELATKSVVQLYVYDKNDNLISRGSGFVAFDSQTIITNYHVIEHGYKIEFAGNEDTTIQVSTVYNIDEKNDIAILQFEDTTESFIPLSFGNTMDLKKGENVVAIGNPLGLKNTVSKGSISNFIEHDGVEMIQFTAAISNGSSGGALFNDGGKIIGITTASYIDGQNLNLAIPSSYITTLYNKHPILETVSEFYDNNFLNTITPGVLTVGVCKWPPFVYTDPTGLNGIEIDILNSISKEIGLEIEFKEMDFEILFAAIENNKVDCLAGGLMLTTQRLQYAIATNPVAPVPMDSIPANPKLVTDMSDVVFYISKNNVKLQAKFNEAIYKFQNDGTFVEIFEKYGIEYKVN